MNPKVEIDEALVRRLIDEQFPHWRELTIERVHPGGWDHRTFRLGEELAVRLPSAERYSSQPRREARWLPRLGEQLPISVPEPVAAGEPGSDFPWPWTVLRWLPGITLCEAETSSWQLERVAEDLGEFLVALHGADTSGGPGPGAHNFHRGGRLQVYDRETRDAVRNLGEQRVLADAAGALDLWQAAMESEFEGRPVWVHGDVSGGNLLVDSATGWLTAVIDWGCLAVGDPACDLAPAWSLFDGMSRGAFERALAESSAVDEATWRRAAGWVLWKSLITLAGSPGHQLAITTLERLGVEVRRDESTTPA